MRPSEVYCCPVDIGLDMPAGCRQHTITPLKLPSDWLQLRLQCPAACVSRASTRARGKRQADPGVGLAGKNESWAPEPARYISWRLNPGAPPVFTEGTPPHGYGARGTTPRPGGTQPTGKASGKFTIPVLFVDGHSKMHNFTRSLTEDPGYPYEPTTDWIWYKTRRRPNHGRPHPLA